MPQAKSSGSSGDSSSSGSSSSSSKTDDKTQDVSYAPPGGEEPELIHASFGEEGEDPYDVGFVGTKPKD